MVSPDIAQYFRRELVPMLNEHTIRIFMATATLIGVPVLLLLAVWKWIGFSSRDLPHWRNGLGMTGLLFAISGRLWCFLAFNGAAPTAMAQALMVELWSFETSVASCLLRCSVLRGSAHRAITYSPQRCSYTSAAERSTTCSGLVDDRSRYHS
jgi:hypothetical protein